MAHYNTRPGSSAETTSCCSDTTTALKPSLATELLPPPAIDTDKHSSSSSASPHTEFHSSDSPEDDVYWCCGLKKRKKLKGYSLLKDKRQVKKSFSPLDKCSEQEREVFQNLVRGAGFRMPAPEDLQGGDSGDDVTDISSSLYSLYSHCGCEGELPRVETNQYSASCRVAKHYHDSVSSQRQPRVEHRHNQSFQDSGYQNSEGYQYTYNKPVTGLNQPGCYNVSGLVYTAVHLQPLANTPSPSLQLLANTPSPSLSQAPSPDPSETICVSGRSSVVVPPAWGHVQGAGGPFKGGLSAASRTQLVSPRREIRPGQRLRIVAKS